MRYVQTAPISRDMFDRLARIASAKGGDVGAIVYGCLRDLCKDLPVWTSRTETGKPRYKVDRVPLVAGFVVRLHLSRMAFVILDGWTYAEQMSDAELREALKRQVLKTYGAIPSDDRQLNLKSPTNEQTTKEDIPGRFRTLGYDDPQDPPAMDRPPRGSTRQGTGGHT